MDGLDAWQESAASKHQKPLDFAIVPMIRFGRSRAE